jgi:hypothetical protein
MRIYQSHVRLLKYRFGVAYDEVAIGGSQLEFGGKARAPYRVAILVHCQSKRVRKSEASRRTFEPHASEVTVHAATVIMRAFFRSAGMRIMVALAGNRESHLVMLGRMKGSLEESAWGKRVRGATKVTRGEADDVGRRHLIR